MVAAPSPRAHKHATPTSRTPSCQRFGAQEQHRVAAHALEGAVDASEAAAVAHTASMDAADAAGLPKGLREHWRVDAQSMQAKAAQHAEVHIRVMREQLELAEMHTSYGMGPYANGAFKAAARSAVDGANVMTRCAAELVSSGAYANEAARAHLRSRWYKFDEQQRAFLEEQLLAKEQREEMVESSLG